MTPWQTLLFLIVDGTAVFCAVRLGNRKGRPGLGWALGLALSWAGFLIMLAVPQRVKSAR